MAQSPTNNMPGEILVGSLSEVLKQAAHHFNHKEYAAAAAICHEVIAQDGSNSEALHILGHIALQIRDLDTAVGYFVRAVRLSPTDPRFNRSFAQALETSARSDQAIHAWVQYLTLEPNDADGQLSLARLFTEVGNTAAATDAYECAASIAPENIDVRFALAVSQYKDGRLTDAIANFKQVLKTKPNWAQCHNGLAVALRENGQYDQAIVHGKRAIELDPHPAEAHNNLGLILFSARRPDEAILSLERANELNPNDAEILTNLGVVAAHAGYRSRAKRCFLQALEVRSDWADALLNLANLLRQEDQLEEAVRTFNKAIGANPNDYRIFGSLALTHLNLNAPEAAIANYEKALALAPNDAELRKGLGIAQLLLGQFHEGWRNYEARLLGDEKRVLDLPRWNGEDLNGGTLLVHSEQGFGDTLQFCRYLPLIADKSNVETVIFECQKPLLRLLNDIGGADLVIARGDALPAADRHVPLLSLPAIFETELDTIPASQSYIAAPKDKLAIWANTLQSEKPNIGIVWEGNPNRQDDEKRSCPVEAFEPILEINGAQIYSLQVDATEQDRNWISERGVIDPTIGINDFSDTAAIITTLDLVVTVDTATAHLSGALGTPVWVLLGHAADWRYLMDRTKSPWYPNMRLFRQTRRGDWGELANRVSKLLSRELNLRKN